MIGIKNYLVVLVGCVALPSWALATIVQGDSGEISVGGCDPKTQSVEAWDFEVAKKFAMNDAEAKCHSEITILSPWQTICIKSGGSVVVGPFYSIQVKAYFECDS